MLAWVGSDHVVHFYRN